MNALTWGIGGAMPAQLLGIGAALMPSSMGHGASLATTAATADATIAVAGWLASTVPGGMTNLDVHFRIYQTTSTIIT